MTKKARVLVVGHGEMGRAMEYLLAPRHDVVIWQRSRDGDRSLVDSAASCEFVILCIPATPVAELASTLLPALDASTIILSIAKGLDALGRPAGIALEQVCGKHRHYGVIYGPMISEEIRRGRPAFAEVGLNMSGDFARVAGLFRDSGLAVEAAADVVSISWAAVMKNVYAILFGIADQLELGDNLRGFLVTRSLEEMQRIVTRMGGDAAAVTNLAGLADLVTTATSAGSHHHELGRRLARGETNAIDGEGVHTLATLQRLGLLDDREFPLYRLAREVVAQPPSTAVRMNQYLSSLGAGRSV